MTDIFKRLGLRRMINVSGTETPLGGAPACPEVREAVAELIGHSVYISELQSAACDVISRATGAEAPRQLQRQLAMIGLQAAGGASAVLCSVGSCEVDSKQKYRLRQCVRDLAGSGSSETDAVQIDQLDAGIDQAARTALADATVTRLPNDNDL